MDFFSKNLPYLLAGVSVGGQYALIAIGYTMVYGILRLINFAHGDIFMVAGLVTIYASTVMPLYLSLPLTVIVTVILAMVFTARRRQRVIPVIAPPVNRALEMVKHIGSLYFQRHDNADLMAKKYQFFVEEVRKLTMIDLDDENHLDDAYLQLQHASGIPRDELRQQLQEIVAATEIPVKDKKLMRHIDYLNHILEKLK